MPITTLKPIDFVDPRTRSAVTRVALEFMAEANYPATFDEDHFFFFWEKIITADIGVFFVAKNEIGEVFGVLGAMFGPDSFSGHTIGIESFWFIRESMRGTRDGLRLFQAFENECDRRGCKIRMMAHLEGLRGGALSELYKRRGYSPAESFFRKVV